MTDYESMSRWGWCPKCGGLDIDARYTATLVIGSRSVEVDTCECCCCGHVAYALPERTRRIPKENRRK